MDLQTGQRWRWRYTAGHGSDLILEVIDPNMLKTIQIIKPYGPEDYIGRTFRKDQMMTESSSSHWEYLEGQDKPS